MPKGKMSTTDQIKVVEQKLQELGEKRDSLRFTADPTTKKEKEKIEKEMEGLGKQLEKLEVLKEIEDNVAKAKEYLPFIQEIIANYKGDASEIVKYLFNLFLDLAEELKEERKRVLKFKATGLYLYYKELRDAGFNKKEAFQTILSQGHSAGGIVNLLSSVTKASDQILSR